jgi:hypothetical protein
VYTVRMIVSFNANSGASTQSYREHRGNREKRKMKVPRFF